MFVFNENVKAEKVTQIQKKIGRRNTVYKNFVRNKIKRKIKIMEDINPKIVKPSEL